MFDIIPIICAFIVLALMITKWKIMNIFMKFSFILLFTAYLFSVTGYYFIATIITALCFVCGSIMYIDFLQQKRKFEEMKLIEMERKANKDKEK